MNVTFNPFRDRFLRDAQSLSSEGNLLLDKMNNVNSGVEEFERETVLFCEKCRAWAKNAHPANKVLTQCDNQILSSLNKTLEFCFKNDAFARRYIHHQNDTVSLGPKTVSALQDTMRVLVGKLDAIIRSSNPYKVVASRP